MKTPSMWARAVALALALSAAVVSRKGDEVIYNNGQLKDNWMSRARLCSLASKKIYNLITELDQGLPGDLPLHCTVRWLSKGQVHSRFFELLDAEKLLMEEKDKDYPELSDLKWIMDLAFLVDMLCHLDRLNMTLQGKLKMLPDLVQSVFAFVNKLKLFQAHIQKGDLTHFPTLLKASRQVTRQICNTG
ncbi:protein transcription factor II-I repeat domain-containing protein 2B-like protein [Silurus meridionalis]|nr:protein transcription factor II-I repeat domain-containing protein 2B-like protein [Silurus meridionalis]